MITCPACGTENTPDSSFCTECREPLRVKDNIGTVDTPNPEDYRPRLASGDIPELAPGTLFADRYTIVEKIGQGGMGTVYRATEKLGSIEREIALKLIRADRMGDASAVDRLMSEGVLTQDIRHNNVVAVYNVGVAQDAPFVAMEFVNGISLREWIRRQRYADTQKDPPPLPVVASLLRAILDGLDAAHSRGVVHRDLKPENVILLGDPTPEAAPLKILDFGIASAPGKAGTVTGTGLGTPNYMAPEQITNPAGANASSDLYSLSKMFYELLMGVLPTGHWQPPSGGRGDVPEGIDTLILSGLSDAQRQRPQTAADYRAALDKAVGQVKPHSLFDQNHRPPPPPPPAGKLLNKPLLIGAGVAALVVLGVVAIGNDGGGPDYPPDPPPDRVTRDPYWTDYSGTWTGQYGTVLQVSVDDAGNVSGSGSADQYQFGVNGSIQGGTINFTYDNGAAFPLPVTLPGDWCHPVLTLVDPNSGQTTYEEFHVNHAAGADCPVLYED
jgi:serine/threonine protein kinase